MEPTKRAKRMVLVIQPSENKPIKPSKRAINAVNGLNPCVTSSPKKIPDKRDTTTSFVIIAMMMIKSGITTERTPKFSMIFPHII